MNRPLQFTKPKIKPKRYHGYAVLLFILGTLLPPLAVAARFGIGRDFFINLILTICGYIPGHCHNFYIQNIRNNKNNRRTPKWAIRYGLIDTSEIERKQRKSQWANRYNERLPHSTLEDREVEEGQIASQSLETNNVDQQRPSDRPDLWDASDESYYGRDGSSSSLQNGNSGGRWRYPANFDDTDMPAVQSSKKVKKDRWARTEDARRGIGMEDPARRKKKKKKKSRTVDNSSDFIDANRRSHDSTGSLDAPEQPTLNESRDRDQFDHEF